MLDAPPPASPLTAEPPIRPPAGREAGLPQAYVDPFGRSLKARRLAWMLVERLLFRSTPRGVLHGWRVWLLRRFGAQIGKGCRVAPSCRVWAPWNLKLGNRVALGDGVDCYCVAKISIGDKVAVSQRAFLCSASHDIASLNRPLTLAPIEIQDHAWVCAEAFVGPGVTVGEGAVVGARAAAFRDCEAWTTHGGVPARPLGRRTLKP